MEPAVCGGPDMNSVAVVLLQPEQIVLRNVTLAAPGDSDIVVDIEWSGIDFPEEKFDELQAFDHSAWRQEVLGQEELFLDLHDRLPPEMIYERELLICRL